jgi:pyruvate kinase
LETSSAHILVFTSNRRILTQLNLLWGVKSFFYDNEESTDDTVTDVNQIAVEKGYAVKRRLFNQPCCNAN